MTELPKDGAVRLERARGDFVKGTVRPDAPGMVYYPAIKELSLTYDLSESVIAKMAREDDWLGDRVAAMTTSMVTPFSAAVDADPGIVRRSELVVQQMEAFDDKVFALADRAMAIAEKAMLELENEEDPIRAIRALKSVAQTIESFHRTAKTAYDPAAIRPDNTTNILSLNIRADDREVADVAAILLTLQQKAIDAGVPQSEIDVIEGEVVEDE